MGANRKYELIVIGGSAGSLAMVLQILSVITIDMKIAIIIVLHRKQTEDTILVELLSTRTKFNVKEADDKDEILPGTIYVAPAGYHVLIEKNKILSLDSSEKVNFSRPSIDVTFESAADVYGNGMAAILLSGANSDGVQGLIVARRHGSLIVVQDPDSAEFPVMPRTAVANVPVDLMLHENNLRTLVSLFS